MFRWFADEHVRNHPRWDPYIELWLDDDIPIRVGTVIRRRNTRSGTPVEGTMEVTEYQPNRALGVITRDGPIEIHGRATFEAADERTMLTLSAEFPDSLEAAEHVIRGNMAQSLRNMKRLMEEEL